MGSASENAAEAQMVQNTLNIVAANGPPANVTPGDLASASAVFCGLEIWKIEALGLLDSYTCTAASCSRNINDDGQLIGSVTISGLSGGQPRNFIVPRFIFIPSSLPDPSLRACPTIPATLTIVDDQNNSHSISCTIEGDDANNLVVGEA